MPIYEYECQACGYRHEAIQKMSDDPIVDCPSCSEPELKKLISAAAFRLKGGGWYETDFKSGKKKNLAQGETKDAKKSADKPADKNTSTDAKKPKAAQKSATKAAAKSAK